MAEKLPPLFPKRLTRAGKTLADRLAEAKRPIITPNEIARVIAGLYMHPHGLYLRKPSPDASDYRRLRKNLTDANIIAPDPDYGSRAYRVLATPDLPADEICCLVDPYCYISHISAMQRYGLTQRRPNALRLSRPTQRVLRLLITEKSRMEHQAGTPTPTNDIVAAHVITHPKQVRGRPIDVFHTAHPGHWIQVRSSYARISTIGQTFLDTLEQPSLCGGMPHVLEVWQEHTKTYLEEVIQAVDQCQASITKVRAGYILEERLEIRDERIEGWRDLAQRGGSRLLDPMRKYAPSYSERWMLSINV